MSGFVGRFELVSSENYDAFVEATTGVGAVRGKVETNSKPSIETSIDGAVWNIHIITGFKALDITFELGKRSDQVTSDGRITRTAFACDGNRLIQIRELDDLQAITTWTFTEHELVIGMSCNGVTAKRVFKRT